MILLQISYRITLQDYERAGFLTVHSKSTSSKSLSASSSLIFALEIDSMRHDASIYVIPQYNVLFIIIML